ncbi:hypothetical protein [Azospirillum aestuarii]|uniref:hypothetical protein n=1 Tax=Azospirillum aestuarii TaxID=2802052 RepID=UPI004054C882
MYPTALSELLECRFVWRIQAGDVCDIEPLTDEELPEFPQHEMAAANTPPPGNIEWIVDEADDCYADRPLLIHVFSHS